MKLAMECCTKVQESNVNSIEKNEKSKYCKDQHLRTRKQNYIHRLTPFIICLTVLINITFSVNLLAATYYVDPVNGNNGNSGNSLSPWKTVDWAESHAANGSTIYLMPGNYGSTSISSLSNNDRNSWGDGLVFTKLPGDQYARPEFKRLSISGDVNRYITFDNIYVNCPYGDGATVPLYIPSGHHIKISNSEIKGVAASHESSSTLYLIQFGDNGGPGVSNLILENSNCHHSRTGIRLEGNSYGGIVFRGNLVHDFGGSMFKLEGNTNSKTVLIENNHIYTQLSMTSNGGDSVHGSGLSLRCENVTARNNIIRACAGSTQITTYRNIFPTNGYRNMRFENNLLYDSRSPYYSVRLDDVGSNLVFNNNTITGRHYDGRTKANYYNNVFRLDAYAANVDKSTIEVCNNIFVGSVTFPLHSGDVKAKGNLIYSYFSDALWRDQNWINANLPGNKVYCWNTSEPTEFRTSGVIFGGGSLFDQYAYYRIPSSSYAPGSYHNIDLGDSFDLADGSEAIGFADTGYSTPDAIGSCEGNGSYVEPTRLRDADPDTGAYEYGAKQGSVDNNAPVLEPIGDKFTQINELLSFVVNAADLDGDTLTYSANSLPQGASFNTNTRIFTWMPQQDQARDYLVTFSVSDALETVSETITISVSVQDDDADSLPDFWELQYFSNLNQGPDDDPDIDGLTNIQEFQGGTDPTVYDEIPQSLVLNMKFNDDPANGVLDSSPYSNDGNTSGTSIPTLVSGNSGNAYEFDGIDDYVDCGTDSTLNLTGSLTISAWIFPKTFGGGGYGRILDKGDGTKGYSFYVKQSTSGISFITYGGVISNSNSGVIALNKWQHAVVVYDEITKAVTFYIDGLPVGSSANAVNPLDSSASHLAIGIRGYDPNRAFNGIIDEVRVYNEALTDNEIMDIFNDEPSLVFSPIGDKQVDEGAELTFTLETVDPSIQASIYDHNLPNEPAFTDNTFSWMPSYDNAGSYEVTFIASHGDLEDLETITITVNNVNRSPVIDPVGNKIVVENALLTFSINATDPDSDNLSYTAVGMPSGSSFAGNTFQWVPTYEQAGTYLVSFIATDGQFEDIEGLTITVNNVNRDPLLAPIGNKVVNEGQTLSFTVSATDPDGDILSYSISGLPSDAVFNQNTFTWTPSYNQAGSYNVTFTVSDGSASDFETVVITVQKINRAPVLDAIGDKSVSENETLSFSITAIDPDGDQIEYFAQNLPVGALLTQNIFTWTPAAGQAGTYQVSFVASDGQAGDSETITITVDPINPGIDGLVGHWKLDDQTGTTAIDSSGHGNTGQLINGPLWTDGNIDGALRFDGINDFVNCGNGSDLNFTGNFTISAWINPASYGQHGFGRIVDRGSSTTGCSFYIRERTKSLAYVIYGGRAIRSDKNVINLNTWQHVAVVFNQSANSITFYVNGSNAGTVPYKYQPKNSSGSPLLIGIRGYDMLRQFNGSIDDVQIYNRALTATEINQLKR